MHCRDRESDKINAVLRVYRALSALNIVVCESGSDPKTLEGILIMSAYAYISSRSLDGYRIVAATLGIGIGQVFLDCSNLLPAK